MTGGDLEVINHCGDAEAVDDAEMLPKDTKANCTKDKLKKYSDDHLTFDEISMPEIEVIAYFLGREGRLGKVETKVKLKRVMRYQHLSRDFVDEKDYPPSQEYFLYANEKVVTDGC